MFLFFLAPRSAVRRCGAILLQSVSCTCEVVVSKWSVLVDAVKFTPQVEIGDKLFFIHAMFYPDVADKNNHVGILGTINPKKSYITRKLLEDIIVCIEVCSVTVYFTLL